MPFQPAQARERQAFADADREGDQPEEEDADGHELIRPAATAQDDAHEIVDTGADQPGRETSQGGDEKGSAKTGPTRGVDREECGV